MAVEPFLHAIAELQNPSDLKSQIVALKRLKNDIIGHTEKKEALIKHGIVDILAQLLANAEKARGKRKSQETNGTHNDSPVTSTLVDEEEVCLQAIIVLGSLAIGGPSFAVPLVKGSVVPVLLPALSPSQNTPKIIVAALNLFVFLAESDRFADPNAERFSKSPAVDDLYSPQVVQVFAEILSQKSDSSALRDQVHLTCKLLKATCHSEHQRNALVAGGVLDVLAAHLVSRYVFEFRPAPVHPPATSVLPSPPRTDMHLGSILALTAVIVDRSKYRVHRLLYSPTVMLYLPFKIDPTPEMYSAGKQYLGALEASLPRVDVVHHREVRFSEAFPALGSVQPTNRSSGLMDLPDQSQGAQEGASASKATETMMIPFLLHLIKEQQGLCRLEATRLLCRISKARRLSVHRERMVALCVIPPIVDMLGEPDRAPELWGKQPVPEKWLILEQAPAVLAELLDEPPNLPLQNAASEAHVINKVCEILKGSFEPLHPRPPPWSSEIGAIEAPPDSPPSYKLGAAAIRSDFVHVHTCRESGLLLLAAMASKEDPFRKQFTEGGIIPHVINSLTPFQDNVLAEWNQNAHANRKERLLPGALGNDVNVLLAACKAAKNLSRSPSLLRTSLIDVAIAKPIYGLLKNPNVSVLIAATDVVCNLTVELSPTRKVWSVPKPTNPLIESREKELRRWVRKMKELTLSLRQDLIDAGAIRTLSEHAHSADSKIRLGALWALKHLVNESKNEIKNNCFEELGTGWLVQIISGGSSGSTARPADTSLGVKTPNTLTMGTANAAGERVDLLNAVDEPMDTEESSVSDSTSSTTDADILSDKTIEALSRLLTEPNQDDGMIAQMFKANRSQLLIIKKHEEVNNALQAHKDEQCIQSQGLDFVRNLIQGPDAAEMIDTLFNTLGANRVFDIVHSKLKLPSPNAQSTSVNPGGEAPDSSPNQAAALAAALSTPAPEVISSALFILTHIAAGAPRHRQQLISQPSLLRSLIPLLNHEDPGIRVSIVWTLNNLTWVDDDNDAAGARKRAMELKMLGFEEALREHINDESLDMRERVSQAIEQMRALLNVSTEPYSRSIEGRATT